MFSCLQALINCNVSEKSYEGIARKCKKPPLLGILVQNGQFWTVFGQNGRNGIFFQKSAWNIFSAFTSPNCKVSEKSNEGIPRKMRKTSIFGHFGPKWPILDSFWPNWAKRDFFFKKALGTFFLPLQALTNCKVSEKSTERFPRKSVAYVRTCGRTNVRMNRRNS